MVIITTTTIINIITIIIIIIITTTTTTTTTTTITITIIDKTLYQRQDRPAEKDAETGENFYLETGFPVVLPDAIVQGVEERGGHKAARLPSDGRRFVHGQRLHKAHNVQRFHARSLEMSRNMDLAMAAAAAACISSALTGNASKAASLCWHGHSTSSSSSSSSATTPTA
jgi:hypothetical protein